MHKRGIRPVDYGKIAIWSLSYLGVFSICGYAEDSARLRCGHWAVHRVSQMLGVPTGTSTVLGLLPSDQEEDSFSDLSNALAAININSRGYHRAFSYLQRNDQPFIAHLESSHYVVVSRIEDDQVYYFDLGKKLSIWSKEEFVSKWSGKVLEVSRKSAQERGIVERTMLRNRPCVQFKTLLLDKGRDLADGTVEYVYQFKNLGSSALSIHDIKTDCKCLEAIKPDGPIKPGGSSEIRLKYKYNKYNRSYSHKAIVKSNDPKYPMVQLSAYGISNFDVEVVPHQLDMGELTHAQSYLRYVRIMSSDELRMSAELSDDAQDLMKLDYFTLNRHDIADLSKKNEVVFGLSDGVNLMGLRITPCSSSLPVVIDSTVIISTNAKGHETIEIPIKGEIVSSVRTIPSTLFLGKVSNGSRIDQIINLRARSGCGRFKVHSIDVGIPGVEAHFATGYEEELEVSLEGLIHDLKALGEVAVTIEIGLESYPDDRVSMAVPVVVMQ